MADRVTPLIVAPANDDWQESSAGRHETSGNFLHVVTKEWQLTDFQLNLCKTVCQQLAALGLRHAKHLPMQAWTQGRCYIGICKITSDEIL